jgi:hypothetical protein
MRTARVLVCLLTVLAVMAPAAAVAPAVDRVVGSSEQSMRRPSEDHAPGGGNEYSFGASVMHWCPASDATFPAWKIENYPPMCFHWVWSPGDEDRPAPYSVYNDMNAVPTQVQQTATVFRIVWEQLVSEWYRTPASDEGVEGSNDLDIYLADLAGEQYGYCDPDDDTLDEGESRIRPVHCVVDNDYLADDMCPCPPNVAGIAALKTAAAHELFHAFQCAYDCFAPMWLREGTAVWMEDQVVEDSALPPPFDDINQHYWYLGDTQMHRPGASLLQSGVTDDSAELAYGSWLLWRHLGERFGPTFMQDVWDRIEAAPGDEPITDAEALAAIADEVDERDGTAASSETAWRRAFNKFAADTYYYEDTYDEGVSYYQHIRDRTALRQRPPAASVRLTGAKTTTGPRSFTGVDGLAHRYARFVRGSGLPSRPTLRVTVNVATTDGSPQARLIVRRGAEDNTQYRLRLDGQGDDTIDVPFGRSVREVVLVVTNGRETTPINVTYSATVLP